MLHSVVHVWMCVYYVCDSLLLPLCKYTAVVLCHGWPWLRGQLAVELDKSLHEAILEGNPLQLEGWSEKTILDRERFWAQQNGLGLYEYKWIKLWHTHMHSLSSLSLSHAHTYTWHGSSLMIISQHFSECMLIESERINQGTRVLNTDSEAQPAHEQQCYWHYHMWLMYVDGR